MKDDRENIQLERNTERLGRHERNAALLVNAILPRVL